jgi:ATP-dependent Clp protease ATP-binding subunit ClpC
VFERYTERARRSIYFARYEALHRNATAIETSDLLVGMTHDKHQPDCPFAFLYDRRDEFRELCGFSPLNGEKPIEIDLALSETSKKVLGHAAKEADRDRRYALDEGHLFRGLLLVGDTTSALLLRLDYTLDTTRAASVVAQRSQPDMPRRRARRLHALLRRNKFLMIAALVIAAAVLYMHFQK